MSRMVTVSKWSWPWDDTDRAQSDIEVQVDTQLNRVDLEIDQGIEEVVSVRMTGAEVNQLVEALQQAQRRLKP